MLKKRNLIFMLLLISAAGTFHGCNMQNNIPVKAPTSGPSILDAATPTPTDLQYQYGQTTSSDGTTAPEGSENVTFPTATPAPTATPTPIPTVAPAPATLNTNSVSTYDFLINRDYPLTASYRPDDLVVPDIEFSFTNKTHDKRKLRKVAADALTELCAAALAEEGLTIYGVSGYRSFDRQYEIYGANIINKGIRYTNLYSAAPGNSEHQTGLAMDVSCKSIGYNLWDSFAETAEGIWLRDNGWRFGYILRYPKDKEHITGYAYEPWHIRYVGVPLAYYLYTNNLTLEEYYGSPSSHTLEELADRPLIDLTTDRFYKLYAANFGSELYYNDDGSIMVSNTTKLPLIREVIVDQEGNPIKLDDKVLLSNPVYDADGNYVFDSEGNVCHVKPYFDSEGCLWLDHDNNPVFLEPLWNADGTLAQDAEGNILYTEPLTTPDGMEVITATGALIPKVPIRDSYGELIRFTDGTVAFYEPFVNPVTQEFIVDSVSGEPLFPSEYYDVPHNTLPLPATESDDWYYDDYDDDYYYDDYYDDSYDYDNYYDTTEETGGFFE